MDTPAQRIIILINENDMTHREFERITGVSYGALRSAMNGKSFFNGKNLIKISQAFGISVDWLLGLTDKRERNK